MRPSSLSPCCRSPRRCRPPRCSPRCRCPPAVIVVPPTLALCPSSTVVPHLTTPCFHPASSCSQRQLGVLWWLVVMPGSSSSSCPLAIACTRLPLCEQLLAVAGVGAGLARPGCSRHHCCGRCCGHCPLSSHHHCRSPPFFVVVLSSCS